MAPSRGGAAPPQPELLEAAKVFQATDEAGIVSHFAEQGFVVVAPVLDDARVEASLNELWTSLSLLGGHPGLRRNDPETWGTDAWPGGSRNFLDPLDPCAEAESWQNRVDPTVTGVFRLLLARASSGACTFEAPEPRSADGSMVVSVDRFGVMRPTVDVGSRAERAEWRTSRNWLHFDQNPWSRPEFFGVQGLLSLSDADETIGGFVTVPGFHKEFKNWGVAHPEGSVKGATVHTIPFTVPLDDEMQARRKKVLVPKGGLLVWDSRMPHENFPNTGTSWRVVQYVTCRTLSADELAKRAAAWHAGLRTGLLPAGFARRFSPAEWALLGMLAPDGGPAQLVEAVADGEALSERLLQAARDLRRAYRLKQTAIEPLQLKEAAELFRSAFATSPALREPLAKVAAAEANYLPFWIL